jgi:hypothetical protein
VQQLLHELQLRGLNSPAVSASQLSETPQLLAMPATAIARIATSRTLRV